MSLIKRITSAAALALAVLGSVLAPPLLSIVAPSVVSAVIAPTVSLIAPDLATSLAPAVERALSSDVRATSLTDYTENKLVDHLFRGTAYTAPGTLYIALETVTCSDSSGGTEVTGGSYARVSVTSGTTNWANTQNSGTGVSSGTNGTTQNLTAFTFPAPTANWGTIVSFSLRDASSGGNVIICNALTTSKTVNNGDAAPSFAIGALTVQMDN